ncbi:hypothetical protein SeMB42_g01613 [Synchytrium endobioticum]|uniref:Structural maintenance of chromosomes protein n=1 Tax=Synchytrium endobioticum TaxID=286115 RepID=A0A507DMS3_9FUNG|nr:hypothetical protein SeMB42_g01613 [Synchytrium endobioticum]
MYVEELIIDGFKSYATRTVISGWDSEFNAITGLNGSGKSNILDAICFVLGIANLTQVRAANLQDLVYKRGQAGIAKASVTIVFNNDDRTKSPVGYEDHTQITITRQIVIGGKNKWIVNGHNAQQQVVANLYQSVQLNVNNPHFLIMQGRITKVLNMKPPEVLAMIEEASGTRMFEERKDKAIKTMAKKDKKLEEITQLLDEEIIPKLDKLREEKRTYVEYQKINVELDHITRLLVAYDYKKYEDKLTHSANELQAKKDRMTELERLCGELDAELKAMEERQAEIQQSMTKDNTGLQDKEDEIKELAKAMVRCKILYDLQTSVTAEEKKNLAQLQESKSEAEALFEAAEQRRQQVMNTYNPLKADHDTKISHLRERENLLQTLITGMSAGGNNEGGYDYQLQQAKTEKSNAQSDVEQTRLKITQLQKTVKEMKPKAQQAASQNDGLVKSMSMVTEVITKIDAEMARLNVDHEHLDALTEAKTQLSNNIATLREQIDRLANSTPGVSFQYADPVPNFDRSKVKGVFVELFSISDNDRQWCMALELCAGGRLYFVVTENDEVVRQLLKAGQKRRVSYIPINTIEYQDHNPEKLALLQRLAPGRVEAAIGLVQYDATVSNAMKFVFGTTILCKDAEAANIAVNNPQIRLKAVTIDGDKYESGGSGLEGGAKPISDDIILKMQELQKLKREYRELQGRLEQIINELAALNKHVSAYNTLKQQKELKEHEMRLFDQQLSTNSHAKIIKQVADMEEQINEAGKASEIHGDRIKKAEQKIARLEQEMSDLTNHREAKLKSIENEVTQAKAAVAQSADRIKAMELDKQVIVQEVAQLQGEIESYNTQIEATQKSIEDNIVKQQNLKEQLSTAKASHDSAHAKLEEERKHMAAFHSELRKLETDRKMRDKQLNSANLERQTLSHELERGAADRIHASRVIDNLLKEHKWIPDHKQLFGQRGGQYEFVDGSIDEATKKKKQLEDRSDRLKNNINQQVIDLLDKMEKKETSLKQMFATVKKDRQKIEETITSLDEYKREALFKTWEKVNGDFGSIFGELLEGNSAKLEPPEGADITEGLEIKVRLGSVWKQSLTELSGGQRSLIALSLILSLLQFKPAPMFKGSQFIVVSLKDGMFNNANVLFKAKFREGVSTVERHAQRTVAAGNVSTGKGRGSASIRRADIGVVA